MMTDQAAALRGLMERHVATTRRIGSDAPPRARSIAVTSGKGGVGKSNVALNLAVALAQAGRSVCLFDANLGLGNIDLLCGLNGYWNLSHVVSGARTLREIVLPGPAGVQVVPGASGLSEAADCPPLAQQDLLEQLRELEETHDVILFDTGAGIHRPVRQFAAAADLVLVVTTPEPTAIADAYATVKALSGAEVGHVETIVNRAESPQQAELIAERLQQTARLFLRRDIGMAGWIPEDAHVRAAVARRRPLLMDSPQSPAARAIVQIARRLQTTTSTAPTRGSVFARIWQRCFRGGAMRV